MIDDILLFVKVVEAGSILAVERKLAIPRSTISRRITHLEESLGKLLLIRTHQGVVLTEDGKFFYERFKNYEQRLTSILSTNSNGQDIVGRLNILLPLSIVNEFLIPHLNVFFQKYPRLELNILHDSGYFNMKKALYDLAIIDYEPLQQTQKIKKIARVEKVFVCTPQYVTRYGLWDNFKDYNKHIIARKSSPDGGTNRSLKVIETQDGKEDEVKVEHRIAFNTFLETKAFVMNHLGIADLPLYMVKREIESNQLIRLFPCYEVGTITYNLMRNIDEDNSCYIAFSNFLNDIFHTYLTGSSI